ncbi:helix-turn-helix transcriptional regulator [Streptomyces viridochromogenes]|uniref:helix-turn-helix transcriptional regulator n=1 Tax=Streptomyces viridochromogenes TaxID=1938 RepID=UPI00069CE92A|nr:helix-turn-helix domain-containing protein [Streptomyces viridochromogenes]
MTMTEIAAEHGVSRQTIHTYRRTGIFPSPVAGEGSTRLRFREDEVVAFFKANPKQPRKKRRFPPEHQGEPVTTTTAHDRLMETLENPGLVGLSTEDAAELVGAYRAAVLREGADSVSDMPAPDCSDFSDLDEAWEYGASAAARRLRELADGQAGAQDG